ncbi:MAG: V-type ATP synthase subunit I [Bacilli bacterium]|nr:V-type ATP synthase subunit I [Bacilli bacterium]NLN80429.1 V-type ATP synthase subunit I [Erysipelotrichia bacterium]
MIVKVQKARLFTFESEQDLVLKALQKSALFMIIPSASSSKDVTEETALLQRISKVLSELPTFSKKKPLFRFHQVSYEKFMLDDKQQLDLLLQIEEKLLHLEEVKKEEEKLSLLADKFTPFREIDFPLNELTSALYARYHIGLIKKDRIEEATKYLDEKELPYQTLQLTNYGPALFYASYYEEDASINEDLISQSFVEVDFPKSDLTLKQYVEELEVNLEKTKTRILTLNDEIKTLALNKSELEIFHDRLQAEIDRKKVVFAKTEHTTYLDGWVRSDQVDLLKEEISKVTTDFEMDISDPKENEVPPTALKNNKFVSQFETITNMFSVPNHKEIDPNPMMAFWYWIIFGIMMGDVGYGLLMLILFGLGLWLLKPKGGFKQLLYVFFYSGITSVLAGILFGSFFGADFDLGHLVGKIFGQQNWTSVILNPVNDPIIMLGFSLVFGVLHIINGLGLKMALLIKRKDILGAIADGLSWILVLVGLLFVAAQMVIWGDVKVLMYIGLGFAGLGALILLFLAGRKSKNIFGKITGGLGAIYSSTSYLSDILSYSRILALSLSSAVIASTMNLLAKMIQGSWFGFILSLLVYLIGHIFNFAMGLLSAYVHDGRLQYIEFFNKFFEGDGYLFEPFAIRLKQVHEIEFVPKINKRKKKGDRK